MDLSSLTCMAATLGNQLVSPLFPAQDLGAKKRIDIDGFALKLVTRHGDLSFGSVQGFIEVALQPFQFTGGMLKR
jgi:hypothetical protein